jgi:hypothetical protein
MDVSLRLGARQKSRSFAGNRLSRKCNSGAKTSNSIAWSVPGIAPPKKPGGDAAKDLAGEDHFESARAGQGQS